MAAEVLAELEREWLALTLLQRQAEEVLAVDLQQQLPQQQQGGLVALPWQHLLLAGKRQQEQAVAATEEQVQT